MRRSFQYYACSGPDRRPAHAVGARFFLLSTIAFCTASAPSTTSRSVAPCDICRAPVLTGAQHMLLSAKKARAFLGKTKRDYSPHYLAFTTLTTVVAITARSRLYRSRLYCDPRSPSTGASTRKLALSRFTRTPRRDYGPGTPFSFFVDDDRHLCSKHAR